MTGTFKNLKETPAPKASILVAIARVNIQNKEIHFMSFFSSFENTSIKNLHPNPANIANTIHFEYFSSKLYIKPVKCQPKTGIKN